MGESLCISNSEHYENLSVSLHHMIYTYHAKIFKSRKFVRLWYHHLVLVSCTIIKNADNQNWFSTVYRPSTLALKFPPHAWISIQRFTIVYKYVLAILNYIYSVWDPVILQTIRINIEIIQGTMSYLSLNPHYSSHRSSIRNKKYQDTIWVLNFSIKLAFDYFFNFSLQITFSVGRKK